MRLRSYNEKPGLVEIRLSSVEDKVAALRRRRNLHQAGYGSVFIRSSHEPYRSSDTTEHSYYVTRIAQRE